MWRLLLLGLISPLFMQAQSEFTKQEETISNLLDNWHKAAAIADENTYFSYLDTNAIYLGTDASERWTKAAFRTYAHPYFARGKAWSFTARSRHIYFSPDGSMAWFEELLDTQMGVCRGSGVLQQVNSKWRILQYNLSVMVPNEKMKEVKGLIEKP
jgi:hypothetical protein